MATKDRTSLKNDFANGKYATGEKFADLIDSMKVVQLPVVDPQALGTSLSFIDSISQDADGKITATKKTLDLANAHELNPFKGWYKTGDTLPTAGFDGAYLYFTDTSELTGQTTIYRWNGTTYADTGTVVDTSNVQTFGSGQQVNSVKIKDESGVEAPSAQGVLSAEAGKKLGDEIFTTDSVSEQMTYTDQVSSIRCDNNGNYIATPNSTAYKINVYSIEQNGVLHITGDSKLPNRVFVVGKISEVADIVDGGVMDEVLSEGVASDGSTVKDFAFTVNVQFGDMIAISTNESRNVNLSVEFGYAAKTSKVEKLQEDVENIQQELENINGMIYEPSANIHNSLPFFEGNEYTATDGRDWKNHNITTEGLTNSTSDYNVTWFIPIDYSSTYKCNVGIIRRIVAFKEDKSTVVGYIDRLISAGEEIVFSSMTGASNIKYIRFMYKKNNEGVTYTPDMVRFGKYSDNIDVPYGLIPYDKFGNRIVTEDFLDNELSSLVIGEKVVTSVGSSGFANMAGGQYCLTQTQKDTYGITDGLTVTKVLQVLLNYDVANICAYSGYPSSAIFFNNGCAGYILKNAVTLKADGTDTTYQWDTSSIDAQMTSNLSSIKVGSIGIFNGTLNGIAVRVSVTSGGTHTIKPTETLPFDITIPAGSMLLRSPYTSSNADAGTITNGLKGTTGLILQIGANSEGATAEEIFNYCELAIKESGCKWFIVLRQNAIGDLDYSNPASNVSDLNKAAGLLRAKYGSRFIDHMAYMTSLQALIDQGITPTTDATYTYNGSNNNDIANYTMPSHLSAIPSDMECIATRRVPSSFWYGAWRITDEVAKNEEHFNAQGLECLGKYLYKMIRLLKIE